MESNPKKKCKGFTLIELLVVIAIIGILAGMVLVSMNGSRSKARDSRRLGDFRQISPAQESVINDSGYYFKYETTVGTIPPIKNADDYQYLSAVADPLDNDVNKYVWVGNSDTGACGVLSEGQYYCVIAKMEQNNGCQEGEKKYFVVNQSGQKEHCDTNDYVSSPPDICDCVLW